MSGSKSKNPELGTLISFALQQLTRQEGLRLRAVGGLTAICGLHVGNIRVQMMRSVCPNQEGVGVKKNFVAAMISFVLAGIAQGAAAQYLPEGAGEGKSPWYVGFGLGRSFAYIPRQTVDGINSTLSAADGASFSIVDKYPRSTGLKILVGYDLNRYFAVEGGYEVLGKTSVNMDFRSGLNSVGRFNMTYNMYSAFIDALGRIPLNAKWSLIGRVGASYNRVRVDLIGSPITIIASSAQKSETNFAEKFGAGVEYNFSSEFAGRLEWERYKMPDPLSNETFHVDVAMLSLLYHF